jgi:hypothetical protein
LTSQVKDAPGIVIVEIVAVKTDSGKILYEYLFSEVLLFTIHYSGKSWSVCEWLFSEFFVPGGWDCSRNSCSNHDGLYLNAQEQIWELSAAVEPQNHPNHQMVDKRREEGGIGLEKCGGGEEDGR